MGELKLKLWFLSERDEFDLAILHLTVIGSSRLPLGS